MSSEDLKFEWAGRALIALAAAITLVAMLSTGTAQAATASGEVTLTLKASSDLALKQGNKGKAQNAALPVTDLELLTAATLRTSGKLKLGNGKRSATLREVVVQSDGQQATVSAKLGKRRLVVFRAQGKAEIGKSSASLSKAPLSLTGKGADALAQRLGLDSLAAGRVGTLGFAATLPVADQAKSQPEEKKPAPEGIVDPYASQCALSVTEKIAGGAAGPAPAPNLTGPVSLNGGKIDWGFKSSFRSYVFFSGGALVPIAPAEVLNPPLPAPQTGSFRFPAGGGSYVVNDPADSSDDQAIVDGAGEVVLCNAPHGFRIVLSKPTVTIDGEDSRLTVDVDTNVSGVWTPTQRVDLATLDVDGVSPFYNEDARTVTWSGLPTRLTEAGEEVLDLCNPMNPGPCDYEEGDLIDPVTVELKTGTAVAWPFGAGCTLGIPATATAWPETPAAPAALPALTAPESISNGSINWGVRNSLRKTVNSNGVFNLAGGATRSDPTDMEGPGKYFTWPAVSGSHEAGTPGRFVLNGTGSVGLCNTAHGFGTVLSNPTVVIDGVKSRLVMDVATRLGTSWTNGRVDLADVATGGVEKSVGPGPGAGEETVTWTFPDLGADNAPGGTEGNADDADSTNSSVRLAAGGTSGLNLLGGSYKTVGTALNKLSVSIVHPDPTP
jgi:hypothetical protein